MYRDSLVLPETFRRQMEHTPKEYIPLLISLSSHTGTRSPGWSDHATPEQQTATIPLMMSDTASDATIFEMQLMSKELRVTKQN